MDMDIQISPSGQLAAEEEQPCFTLRKGIPGFEKLKDYVIQVHDEQFSILQAVEDATIAFIITDPFLFFENYEFIVPEGELEELGIQSQHQIAVRCIVSWNSDSAKTTINLMAPLVFNVEQRIGKQIVLHNSPYLTRHALWNKRGEEEGGGDSC